MSKLALLGPLLTAGAGVYSAIKGAKQAKQKAPEVQPLPEAPKPEDAAATAAEEAQKKARRIQATNLTRGSALVPDVNIQQKSLLGE